MVRLMSCRAMMEKRERKREREREEDINDGTHQVEIFYFVHVIQWGARFYIRPTTMHLQSPDGGHDGSALWDQTRVSTFYVEELFHADISTEARLCNAESVFAAQF